MRFSRYLGDLVIFVIAALVIYLVGTALLAAWPMWTMMWAMMGFGSGWLLVVLALAIALGAVWLIGRSERQVDARTDTLPEQCPQCRAPVEPSYVRCPECHTALGNNCPRCRQPLKDYWTYCPFCGIDVAEGASTRQRMPGAAQDGTRREQHVAYRMDEANER